MVLAISGGASATEMERYARELSRSLREQCGAPQMGLEATHPLTPELKSPRWVEKRLDREQVHVMVGGLAVSLDSPERNSLRLLQTMLGGQSGRLFIELREKKSLAYTVSPVNFEGMERGYVGTYIASAPTKRQEAVEGIRKVLSDFAKKGPTSREVSRAKEYYLGRRAMDLQSDSAIASHLSIEGVYGLKYRTDAEVARELAGVSSRQIQEACRKYLVDAPMVTAVVG
jgi:zinc protease